MQEVDQVEYKIQMGKYACSQLIYYCALPLGQESSQADAWNL